jgi:biotin carboxyl carrier protein
VTDLEVRVGGERVDPDPDLTLTWVDRAAGVVRVHDGARSQLVLVEGTGSDWTVTIAGRRLPVSVQSWRERTLAEADVAARSHAGTLEVTASLPGLVVAIAVATGSEVAAGEPLLTIEAMKMQNEVRAPRAGRVLEIRVAAGQTVAAGVPLLRLE